MKETHLNTYISISFHSHFHFRLDGKDSIILHFCRFQFFNFVGEDDVEVSSSQIVISFSYARQIMDASYFIVKIFERQMPTSNDIYVSGLIYGI